MRFSLVLLACLVTAFDTGAKETTLAPTSSVEGGNDQELTPAILDEELETEASQNSEIINGDKGFDLVNEDKNESTKEKVTESDSIAEDESGKNDGSIEEDEGSMTESEQQDDIGDHNDFGDVHPPSDLEEDEMEGFEAAKPTEDTQNPNNDADDALPPFNPIDDEQEENEDDETSPSEISLEGDKSGNEGGDDPSDQNPSVMEDEEKYEGFPKNQEEDIDELSILSVTENPTTEVPASNEIDEPTSDFAPTPADSMVAPTNAFDPYPTAYKPPTIHPAVPYVSTGPLKEANNGETGDWGWTESTIDEMEHDATVVIALSVVFGVMFSFSIFVAYQMLENPDGFCASICRITVAGWCGIIRCICYPCRAMCGCTGGSSGGQHMMVPEDGFTNDLELS